METLNTKNGCVYIENNLYDYYTRKYIIGNIEKELNGDNTVTNSNGYKTFTYGMFRYSYHMGRGKFANFKEKEIPRWCMDIIRKVEELQNVPKGYYNHVLINKFLDGLGIGMHTDDEKLYRDENGNVGSVAIISLGNTKKEHIIDGQKIKAEDNQLVIMSTGKLKHMVAPANGIRYSITFRHVPKK